MEYCHIAFYFTLWKNITIHETSQAWIERIPKGESFIYEGHGGQEGVVISLTYKNVHGEAVKIHPQKLDPDKEVIRF